MPTVEGFSGVKMLRHRVLGMLFTGEEQIGVFQADAAISRSSNG